MREEKTEILTAHLRNIYAAVVPASKLTQLQRSLLTLDGTKVYRRIACYVDTQTGECLDTLETPVWMERIHTGEFHNIFATPKLERLEAIFKSLI